MFMELTIFVVIFSFLMVILWKLNSQKNSNKKLFSNTGIKHARKQRKTINEYTSSQDQNSAIEFTEQSTKAFSVEDVVLTEEFLSLKLLTFDQKNQQQQENLTVICQDFRKPHPLLLPLTQTAFEPNELFDLIKTDPQMTAKVLNRVNSSAFALMQPITSIHHAIIYLGIATVKNVALHFALENEVEFENPHQNKAYQKLWRASFLASNLGLLFAKELSLEDAAEVSTRCLLNYLGDMAILFSHPEQAQNYRNECHLYQRVIHTQSTLKVNAQLVGSNLAKRWQLPRTLVRSLETNLTILTAGESGIGVATNENIKNLVCYIACRIADLSAINEQNCIETIRYGLTKQLDFYYLLKNQEIPAIKTLLGLFHDAGFSKKINQILQSN